MAVLTCMDAPAEGQLRATLVASGFNRPLGFVQHPTDTAAQVVIEQGGRVRVLKNGAVLPDDFLNLSTQTAAAGEQGLLGLAFSPDFATTGRVFVCFTNLAGDSVVARFLRSASDPLRADHSTRFDFMWPDGQRVITQPFSNHNGGNLAFGPDGYLYLGFGDGGSSNDPFHHAQNPQSLLGKMLRLDTGVSDADPRGYRIPPTNPFVGQAGVFGEIWTFGMRNPWRWSFDDVRRGGTGAMVIGDVGQNAWEEIDYQPSGTGGLNFGWRNREGTHANVGSIGPFSAPLKEPAFEYSRALGASITGGFVYRGSALGQAYVGRYFFADFATSRIWSLGLTINPQTKDATAGTLTEHSAELSGGIPSPSSFGLDAAGELYVVSYNGFIYRIDGPPGQQPTNPVQPDVSGPRRSNGDTRGPARPR